jgi:hypothetical protein
MYQQVYRGVTYNYCFCPKTMMGTTQGASDEKLTWKQD